MAQIVLCARACVVHHEKLLLVSNDGGYWYLPGGHMKPQETLMVCAKREVYEETGCEIKPKDVLYLFEFYDKSIHSHKVEVVFAAALLSHPQDRVWEDLGEDKSVMMKKWFGLEELQRLPVQPAFLKEGKWLDTVTPVVYKGYETTP